VAAQVIGNDQAITVGGLQGHFELNVFIPMMARNLLGSIKLLASASRLLAEKCVDGIEANRDQNERYAELTLSAATALKTPPSTRRSTTGRWRSRTAEICRFLRAARADDPSYTPPRRAVPTGRDGAT
jgi:hypothetical protein